MVKVYFGEQANKQVKASELMDMGATDFSLDENISELKSERFQDVQAEGDSTISKIEVGGSVPIEFSKEILEKLMGGLSYTKQGQVYKMSNEKPKFYTIVLEDALNNEKWEYLDCIINSLKINVALGGYVTGSVDIIGKTYSIETGKVTGAYAGDSLRALHSNIKLDGTDVSADIEGVEITINNGMEAKGSLNSLYNEKIRRATPQSTQISINKNEYTPTSFKALKEKMIQGEAVTGTIKLGKPQEEDTVVIDIPKMLISSNKRGDYKGAGSHTIELNCSVNNSDKSHLKFAFKGEE